MYMQSSLTDFGARYAVLMQTPIPPPQRAIKVFTQMFEMSHFLQTITPPSTIFIRVVMNKVIPATGHIN